MLWYKRVTSTTTESLNRRFLSLSPLFFPPSLFLFLCFCLSPHIYTLPQLPQNCVSAINCCAIRLFSRPIPRARLARCRCTDRALSDWRANVLECPIHQSRNGGAHAQSHRRSWLISGNISGRMCAPTPFPFFLSSVTLIWRMSICVWRTRRRCGDCDCIDHLRSVFFRRRHRQELA